MATMSRDQQKHFLNRVVEVLSTKEAALKEKFSYEPKPTDKEKLRAIRSGDVPLKGSARLADTLSEAFNFSWLGTREVVDNSKYDPAYNALEKEAGKVEALKLFEKFAR